MEDWTLNLSDGVWRGGSETRSTGQWLQAGGNSSTCPAPNLIEPSDGAILSSNSITFRWNAVSGCTFNGYTFRIKNVPTMDSGGTTIRDTGEGETQRTETIVGWDNTDLYWGVRAANAPAGANWAVRRFRYVPHSSPSDGNAVDVMFIVDLSGSFADDLSNFQAQARGLISALKASNPDIRFGLARFEDYPIPPFGSAADGDKAYERLVDLTSDTDLVVTTLSNLSVRSGDDDPESQLPALFQAATGAGQDLSGAGFSEASIPPGQQANFRDGATKLFLLWTDAPFHLPGDSGNIPYPGPSFSETVDAIKALDSSEAIIIPSEAAAPASPEGSAALGSSGSSMVIGISSGGGGLADLQAIAKATEAVAPSGGVDCDNNGAIDIPEGEPLVCSIAASGEGISAAVRAIVEGAAEPTPSPSPPPDSPGILIEAESDDLNSPMEVGQDSSASGGAYISATSGENTSSPRREAEYSFSVPEEGDYYLWARLYGPDEDSDAIYIGIDSSWNRVYPDTTGQYVWARVATSRNSDEYGFSLEGGTHEIQVGHAELNARLDALYLTDDPDSSPPDAAPSPPPPSSESFELMLEAESGDLDSPFTMDSDNEASGGWYISATSGGNTSSPDEETGYTFSVPEDGEYWLWARLYGPDEDTDAIYIGVDGSWDRVYPEQTGEYIWTRVGPERDSTGKYGVSLESGEHEIHVGHAELYARLDALFITDDWDARPDDTDTSPPADDPDDQPDEPDTDPIDDDPEAGLFHLQLEAEDGDVSSPMSIGSDSSASGGEYISATSGENSDSPEQEASYEFSVPDDGTYYLWALLYGPDEDSDAIYIGINGSWARTYPSSTGEYHWTRVATSRNGSDEYEFSLDEGDHEIQVGHAELYTRLDALYLTDDPDFHP